MEYTLRLTILHPLAVDLVAVPDFAGSGMEEWGLINLRREFLVYDDKFVGATGKKKMMEFITHEIAHMVRQLYAVNQHHTSLYHHWTTLHVCEHVFTE